MKLLELFAGSRSVGKVAESLGMRVWSVDNQAFDGINRVADILIYHPSECIFTPDIIWASPPCTSFSIAAISTHRNMDKSPKTTVAEIGDRLVLKTLSIIRYWEEKNPNLKWYIENPVGLLHKMDYMKGIERAKIYYCRYGDTRMKPTYIFTNNLRTMYNPNGWQPRKKCWNGNTKCQHEAAPRGSRTGTQGLANDYERSKIPFSLAEEILTNSEL